MDPEGARVQEVRALERNPVEEIQKDPVLQFKLRLWENEELLQRDIIDRKERSLNEARNQIYQIIGLYLVFQGVVLTALAQSSTMKCRHWWIPLTLTILADVGTVAGVLSKMRRCDKVKHGILADKLKLQALMRTKQIFIGLGADYNPNNVEHQPVLHHDVPRKKRLTQKLIVVLAIVGFSFIIAVACNLILCH